jgi:hypothetical protein
MPHIAPPRDRYWRLLPMRSMANCLALESGRSQTYRQNGSKCAGASSGPKERHLRLTWVVHSPICA